MKKSVFMFIAGVAMTGLMLTGCTQKYDPSKPEETKQLTPEESKEKLASVGNEFLGKFNPEDQREAIVAVNELSVKFSTFDASALAQYFGGSQEQVMELPLYAAAVAEGRRVAADIQPIKLSLKQFSVIFEADEANQTWVNKGASPDGSIILRCKTSDGKSLEAKLWGDGKTSSYTYNENGVNVTIELTQKTLFTLTLGQSEVIRVVFEQDMKKNDHANFALDANVANLSWTVNLKIASTAGSMAYAMKMGKETLLSMGVNLPKYKLIDKEDNQTYEEWLAQYGRRYDELIRQIGSADAVVNILGEVQAKLTVKNVGQFYTDGTKFVSEKNIRTKEGCEEFCKFINDSQENGLYYNNSIKQAEIIVQPRVENVPSYDGANVEYYFPEAVVYFPADKTTYAIDEYFQSKQFADLVQSLQIVAQKYSECIAEVISGGK